MADLTVRSPEAVLDALNSGVIVLDRDQRIVRWNSWMNAASAYPEEKVHGRLLVDVFPEANLKRLLAAIASALDFGMSSLLTHAVHSEIFPLKTRAGAELLHDLTVAAIGRAPERTCLIHVVDVTMAVRRERYLRDRQNARYDAVVASAPDVILTLDAEGVIHLANSAAVRQFGYAASELIGQHARLLFQAKHAWDYIWRRVLCEDKLLNPIELVAHRKDGSLSYLEVSASRWQSDSRLFVTAIFRDINERRASEAALRVSEEHSRAAAEALAQLNATLEQRVQDRTDQLLQAEEALRQSQKMEAIGQLTGGIAHDFNNLLQGIIGALNMIERRLIEGRISDIDRFVKGALASADRASTLTHRLLAFARRQPIDPRPVEMNQLIGSIEELLRRTIGEKIKMQIINASGLWLVRCDANQLENAVLNLAINARDAMPNGGELTIAASNAVFDASEALARGVRPGEYVRLTIGDNGAGMAPDVLARAFDPFYTTKSAGKGTGLGLSMIYGFVRQSEGSVRIESEVGVGTTVEMCLPRFDGNLEADARDETEPAFEPTSNNEVVLVVEDEDVVRLLVVEVLSDLGYQALEAGDGCTALRILQSSQRIDLLVTDIGLPDINGKQIADTARDKRSNLKILFMTGYAESAANSEFLEKGMQMIAKPFTMDQLSAKIGEMFENRSN